MANIFYPEPVTGSDFGSWGPKELRQNAATIGLLTTLLYNDTNVLKISAGIIGLNDGSARGIFDLDTIETLDYSGITNAYWFTVELSRSGVTLVFTLTRIEGEIDPEVVPDLSAYYNGRKCGYYMSTSKRLIGIGYVDTNGDLARIYTMKSNDRLFIPETKVGVIEIYAGTTAPSGYMICDGSSLVRADYPDLFAVIGITYGAADGTHFSLPDLRGIFPRGAGASGQLNDANGNPFSGVLGTYQNDQGQGHYHDVESDSAALDHIIEVGYQGGASNGWERTSTTTGTTIVKAKTILTNGTNGAPRMGTDTHPANLSINFIIKY